MLDWLRLWPEFIRLNLQKSRHRRRLRRARHQLGTLPLASAGPAPCQSASDSGRAGHTRCEACHRLDRASRYRLVCPDLSIVAGQSHCTADSAAVRPYWSRAALALLLPPFAFAVLGALGVWGFLRFQGLDRLSPLDVVLPFRWANIAAHRRAHFQHLTLTALAAGDPATAAIALFSAAQAGPATPADNHALARLATLGGYHSLADDLHAATLAAHPDQAGENALVWHDDLLLGDRPARLARLALDQLARPDSPREFWLRAFFESIRHPGVSAPLLDDTSLALPHPGLRHALAARAALDRRDLSAAGDQLIALSGLPPGAAVRRFLAFSWLDAGDSARALAAAIDRSHPLTVAESAALFYRIQQRSGASASARTVLRPLLPDGSKRAILLAALILDPDEELVQELLALAATEGVVPPRDPSRVAALWLAARRAGRDDLAAPLAAELASLDRAIPDALNKLDFVSPGRDPRAALGLAATLLPFDRETLYALRGPAVSTP